MYSKRTRKMKTNDLWVQYLVHEGRELRPFSTQGKLCDHFAGLCSHRKRNFISTIWSPHSDCPSVLDACITTLTSICFPGWKLTESLVLGLLYGHLPEMIFQDAA
ncbi:hypothetical protein ILYODFUR_014139 [Ilyodon furcidens]|uniref:Uncharacterized protein n=1 Tax=Ilyodon furcidens TaxID=33524 RepID=A0ABV0UFY7_9TELE